MSDPAPSLGHVARDLAGILEKERPRLSAIDEEAATVPRTEGKWSRKQVLGHLIDSATNNHQRFVRAQLAPALTFPSYEQEKWVATQAYQERTWSDLVGLWSAMNGHLVHVLARVDPTSLDRPCTIGEGKAVTLRFVAEDYVRHLRHHLEQILPLQSPQGE